MRSRVKMNHPVRYTGQTDIKMPRKAQVVLFLSLRNLFRQFHCFVSVTRSNVDDYTCHVKQKQWMYRRRRRWWWWWGLPKIRGSEGKFDKTVLPKNLFDNKITLINYGARFDMRSKGRQAKREQDNSAEIRTRRWWWWWWGGRRPS